VKDLICRDNASVWRGAGLWPALCLYGIVVWFRGPNHPLLHFDSIASVVTFLGPWMLKHFVVSLTLSIQRLI
jgi:hypothetical protein